MVMPMFTRKSQQNVKKMSIGVKVLAGDNKFHCAQCDQKRDTLKRTCIARLPNVLFLHLKRFEFDMEQMRKVGDVFS